MATFKDLNTAYSDGPDKLRNNYACYLHHNTSHDVGLRSFEDYKSPSGRFMVTDYDCCCDPCNHSRSDVELVTNLGNADVTGDAYCCVCTPNLISSQWVGTGNSCSQKSVFEAMWVSVNVPGGGIQENTAHYSTDIVGRTLDVYIGPREINEAGTGLPYDGSGCRWTIWLGASGSAAGLSGGAAGTKVVSYIDHITTTCLKVPTVQFNNIAGHNGLGTITLNDYYGAKVPFVRRDDEVAFPTGVDEEFKNDFHVGRPIHTIAQTGALFHAGGALNTDSEFFPQFYAHINASAIFTPPQTGVSVLLPSGRIGPPFAVGTGDGSEYGFFATSGGPEINSVGFPPVKNTVGENWENGSEPTGVQYPAIRASGMSGIYDGGHHSGIVGYCWPPESGFYATGRKVELCNEVPRFLCVDNAKDSAGPTRNREFVFDTGYYPRFRWEYHPAYPGVEKFTIGTVLCRWEHIPLAYERTKTVQLNGGFNAWHNPLKDKHKKYVYLYETFIDNVAEFTGDMMAVYQSGVPKRLLLPAFQLDPLEDDDQNSQGGDGVAGEYVSPDHSMSAIAFTSGGLPTWGSTEVYQNGIGPAYYGHSGIDGHNIGLKPQNEVFYWNSGNLRVSDGTDWYIESNSSRQIPWLDGIQHGLDRKYGDGSGGCHCNMSVLASRYLGAGLIPDEVDRMNIYSGRCGCWSYYCSDQCRCVPEKLCYFTFQFDAGGNFEINQGALTWNYDRIGWEGQSGIDLLLRRSNNGFATGKESYTPACTAPTFASESGYYFDKGFVMEQQTETSIECANDNMSFEFDDTLFDSSGVAQTGIVAVAYPSYADCDLKVAGCNASPCESGCNSHPEKINVNLYGYSDGDEDECGDVDLDPDADCSYTVGPIDIQLSYIDFYAFLEGNPSYLEPECWYEGYYPCPTTNFPDGIYKVTWEGPESDACGLSYQYLPSGANSAGFRFGPVGVINDNITACVNAVFAGPLGTQTCEPYYASGTYRDGGAEFNPWFDCSLSGSGVTRVDIVLTEI